MSAASALFHLIFCAGGPSPTSAMWRNRQIACRDHFWSRHPRSPILRWTFYLGRVGACGADSKGADPFTDWPIFVRQFSRLENGPNKRLPCSSVAYQPSLTARKSD